MAFRDHCYSLCPPLQSIQSPNSLRLWHLQTQTISGLHLETFMFPAPSRRKTLVEIAIGRRDSSIPHDRFLAPASLRAT